MEARVTWGSAVLMARIPRWQYEQAAVHISHEDENKAIILVLSLAVLESGELRLNLFNASMTAGSPRGDGEMALDRRNVGEHKECLLAVVLE